MWYEPKERTLHSGAGAEVNGQIFDLEGRYGALRLQVTGITSATITFEQSNDNGTTWDGIAGTNTETGVKVTTATANGTFLIPVTGVKKFRARISTYATGTIYVYAVAVPAIVAPMEVFASLVAGSAIAGKVGIDQTTPGTTNGVQVNAALPSGTNNIGDVDIASAIPAGTNLIGKVGIDQTTPGTTNRVDIGAALPAGTAIVGKVGIDQTTDGTTNKVQARNATADNFKVDANLQVNDADNSASNPAFTQITKISKGTVTTAHNAITITTTSTAIDCTSYNAAMVKVTVGAGGGTWKIDVEGCNTSDGTFVDIYDNYDNQLTTGNLTASRFRLFVSIPDHIKIEATEVVDGSACTVEVQPMNV